MKRTGMNDIKDILRQRHDLDPTRDQIAAATGVSAGTVSHVLERAEAAGLSWPLPADLDDEVLRAALPTISGSDRLKRLPPGGERNRHFHGAALALLTVVAE